MRSIGGEDAVMVLALRQWYCMDLLAVKKGKLFVVKKNHATQGWLVSSSEEQQHLFQQ